MLNRLVSLALAGALSLGLISAAPAAQGTGCGPTTGTVSGLAFAQFVNSAIAAITSSFSGASAPATDCTAAAIKGQVWLDTSLTPNVLKQYDGTAWVAVGAIDSANHLWSPPVGGGTASITAASTTDICAAPAAVQTITGTTAITSFGSSCVVGARKTLIFASATPITYNASSMIVPGQRSYTAAAGDMADAIYLGSGNWRIKDISKIDGSSVTNPAVALGTILYGDYGTIPAKTVIANGQALSRATYPDYVAAVTRTQSGILTAGNNTITSIVAGGTRGLGAGMPLEGTGIQAGTTIVSVTSTTILMSTSATANGSQSVTAFLTGYGSGGDTTTVGAKACAGRMLAGIDPLGTTLASAAAVNAPQGSATRTLLTTNLPDITGSFSLSRSALASANENITQLSLASSGATHNYRYNDVSVDPPVTGGSFSFSGSSTPFGIVPPISTAECVVVVLP